MSTSGVYGFRLDDKDIVTRISFDADPSYFGKEVLEYIATNGLEDLRQRAKALRLHPFSEELWESLREKYGKYDFEKFMANPDIEDIIDSGAHLTSGSLDGGQAYIMNLDSEILEYHTAPSGVHEPFSLNLAPKGRYVQKTKPPQFKGIQLAHEIPLSLIAQESIDYHAQAMVMAGEKLRDITYILQLKEEQRVSEMELIKPWLKIGKLIIGTTD